MYVYQDGSITSEHPVRRSFYTAFPWLLLHLPMSAGLLIGGHVSAASTVDELDRGRRWLWGGGLSLGMLGMWVLGQLYRDCDPPGKLIMPKQIRLLPRLLGAIIYALLPLASEESLDATSLISTGAGISAFAVIWETIGGLEKCASVVESWRGKVENFDTIVHVGSRQAEVRRRAEREREVAGLQAMAEGRMEKEMEVEDGRNGGSGDVEKVVR